MSEPEVVDRELTDDMKLKLKGYLGFSKQSSFIYVPKVYRENEGEIPKDLWPRFKLQGMTGMGLAEIEDQIGYLNIDGNNKYHITPGTQRIMVLRKNILGWKNFLDQDGNEIPFARSKNGIELHCMEKLPEKLQSELYNAILDHSKLSSEESEGLEF